ncbi:A-kinase anchor protein 9-like isoform X2 [Corticium candelabrum]|uniref:A-kinase anchor protein 9-like isoform X2 n=1 Tax=Corticium candelabrum TaxID=121492 RepID=UPI002E273626|nr:A-kinase anchor protein 9-like isoform X2 [Corticium candelabrum]
MDEEERKSKLEAGKAQLLKFQKKRAKGTKKKKQTVKTSGKEDELGALEPASVTEDSLSVATPLCGPDTGHHTPGNVSPLPFDSEVSIAAGAREILAQQTDDFEDLLQEAEPSLVSGISQCSLSPSKGTHELMTEGTMDLGGMPDNKTDGGDRSWVNRQLSELQSENDELRLSQLQLMEGKDREIVKLKEQVEFLRSQRDSAQEQGMQIARQQLQSLESELTEKTSQLELLQTELDELGQQNKALVEQKASVGATGASWLQQALDDSQQQLREAQEELTQSYETNKMLQAKWGEQRSALELTYSQQMQQLQVAYQSNQEQLKQAFESQLQQFQAKLLTAESLETEISRVNGELAQIKNEMASKLSEKEREMSQWYERQLADYKMELDELRVRMQDQNPVAAVQQSKIEALQLKHVAEVQELIVKHNGELEEVENMWKEKLEKEKVELKSQLDIAYAQQMEHYKSMVEQDVNKKVQDLCVQFQQKLADLQSENEQYKEQLMAQTATNNRLIEQNKTLSGSVQAMSNEYTDMEEKLQITKEQLNDIESEKEELNVRFGELSEEMKDLSELRKSYEMLEEKRTKDSDFMKSLEDQLQDLGYHKEMLQTELNDLKSTFELECEKARQIPMLEDEIATLKNDKDDAMKQSVLVRQESTERLKSLKEQHSREIDHLRQTMENQEQVHVEMKRREEGQRRADLEQVKEEYMAKIEQAVAAKETEMQREFIEQMQEVRNELECQHSKNIESWKQRCETAEHQATSLQNTSQQERQMAEELESPHQKSDLQRLQVDCEELEKARELLLKQNEWQKRQNETLQRDKAELSRSNERLKDENQDLCRQLQEKEEESRDFARKRADLEGQRGHDDDMRESMNERMKQIEAEKRRLNEQLSTQREVTKKVEGELEEVKQMLGEEKAGYDESIRQLRKQLMEKREDEEQQRAGIELELRAEWNESQRQKEIKLNTLERENSALQQLLSDTQLQLKLSQEVVEQLKSDLTDVNLVRAGLEQETEEQKKALEDLRDELLTHTQVSEELQRSFGKELISVKQQRDSLRDKLASLQVESQTYASVVFEKERLEKALSDYRGQLSVRQQEHDSLEQDLAREKAALQLQLIEKEKLEQLINSKVSLEKQLGDQKVQLESELQAIERELQTKNEEFERDKAAFGKALDEKEHSVHSIREAMREQEEEASRRENSIKGDHQLELSELERTLDSQHQLHLSELEKNLEAQRVADLESAEKDWRQCHDQQLDELERNHQHNVEEIQSEHQRKVDELKAELNSQMISREKLIREEIDQRRMQEIATVKDVHERQTARLIEDRLLQQAARHQREIEMVREEAKKEFMKKLEDARTELEHAHQTEIDILTEGYSEDQTQQLHLLREQLQEKYQRQLTEVTEQQQLEWGEREEKLRIQYEGERKLMSQQESLQWEKTVDEVKKRYSEEISRLELSIRDMADEHQMQFEELKLKHGEEKTEMCHLLQEQHSEAFEELKNSLEKRYHEDLESKESEMTLKCQLETETLRVKLNDEHNEEMRNMRHECEEQKQLAIEELQTDMENKMLKEIKALQEMHLQDVETQQVRHDEELRQKTEKFSELLKKEKEKFTSAQHQFESQQRQAGEDTTLEVDQLQSRLLELERKHKQEKEDIKHLHADELTQMEEKFTEKIAKLHTSVESRIANEKSRHIDELQESVSETEARYQHLKLQLESEFEESKMMLMKQHSGELLSLEMRLRQESQVQLDEMKSRLANEHRQTIQEMESQFEKEMEAMRVGQDQEWKRLKEELENQHKQTVEKRLNEMTQLHQCDLASLREQADEEKQKVIDETNDRVASVVSQLTMSHALEFEQMKSQHSCETQGMQTELQSEFDSRLALLETDLRQKTENSILQLEVELKGITQRLSETEISLHTETEEKAHMKELFDETLSEMERENDILKARLEEQKDVLKSEYNLKLQESEEMVKEAEKNAYHKLHEEQEAETQRLLQEQKNELSSLHMEKFKAVTDQLVKEQEQELEKVRLECERQMLEELNRVRLESERGRLQELEKVHIEHIREKEDALEKQQQREEIKVVQMEESLTQQFQEEKQALEAEFSHQFEIEKQAFSETNENLAAELDKQAIEFEQQKRIEMEMLKQKLEESHAQDLATIREEWDREAQQMVDKKSFELHSQHRGQIDKLLSEFERDLQQAKAETDDKYEQRLSHLREEREQTELSKIATVEEKMKAEIFLLQNKIQEKQTELEVRVSRYANEKAEWELSKQRELGVLENQLRSQLREEQTRLDVAFDEKQKLEHQIQNMMKVSQAEKQQLMVKLEGCVSRIEELESEVTELKRQSVDAHSELEENTEYYEKRLMEKERERETYINRALLVEEDNNCLNNTGERLRAANQQLVDTLSHQVAVALELEQVINNSIDLLLAHEESTALSVHVDRPHLDGSSEAGESLSDDSVSSIDESLVLQSTVVADGVAATATPAFSSTQTSPIEANSSQKRPFSLTASAQTDEGVCDNSRLSLSAISDSFLVSTVTEADRTLLDSTVAESISEITRVTDIRVSEAADVVARLQASVKRLIDVVTQVKVKLEDVSKTVTKPSAEKATVVASHEQDITTLIAENAKLLDEIKAYQCESTSHCIELGEMRAEVQRIVAENENMFNKCQQTEHDRNVAEEERDQAQGLLHQVEEVRRQLTSEMECLVKKSKMVELKQQQLDEERQSLMDRVAELEEEISAVKQQNDVLCNRLAVMENEEHERETPSDRLHMEQELEEKELIISQLQQSQTELTGTIERLSVRCEEECHAARSVQSKLDEVETYAAELEVGKASLEKKLADLQTEDYGQLRSELKRLQQQFDCVGMTIATLEHDKQQLEQQLVTKEEQLREMVTQKQNEELVVKENDQTTKAELEVRELRVQLRNTERDRDEAYRLLEGQKSGKLSFEEIVGMVKIHSLTSRVSPTEDQDFTEEGVSKKAEQWQEQSPWQDNSRLKEENSQLKLEIERLQDHLKQILAEKARLEYEQPRQLRLLELQVQAKSVGVLRERQRWQREIVKSKKLQQPVIDAMLESHKIDETTEEYLTRAIANLDEERITVQRALPADIAEEFLEEDLDAKNREVDELKEEQQQQMQVIISDYERQIGEKDESVRELEAEKTILSNELEQTQTKLQELKSQLVNQIGRQTMESNQDFSIAVTNENNRLKDQLETVEEQLVVTQQQLALKENEVIDLERREREVKEQLEDKQHVAEGLSATVDQLDLALVEKNFLVSEKEEHLRVWASREIVYQRQIALLTEKQAAPVLITSDVGVMTEWNDHGEKTRMGEQLTELERLLGEARLHATELEQQVHESVEKCTLAEQRAEQMESQVKLVLAESDLLRENVEELRQSQARQEDTEAVKEELEELYSKLSVAEERLLEQESEHSDEVEILNANLAEKSRIIAQLHSRVKQLIAAIERRSVELRQAEQQISDFKTRAETLEQRLHSVTRESSSSQTDPDMIQDEAYESDSMLERCRKQVSRCERLDGYLVELLSLANWSKATDTSGSEQQQSEEIGHALERLHTTAVDLLGLSEAQKDRVKADQSSLENEIHQVYKLLQTVRSEAYAHTAQVLRDIQATWQRSRNNLSEDGREVIDTVQKALQLDRSHSLQSVAEMTAAVDAMRDMLTNTSDSMDGKAERRIGAFQAQLHEQQQAAEAVRSALKAEQIKTEALERDCQQKEKVLNEMRKELEMKQTSVEAMQSTLREEKERCDHWQREVANEQERLHDVSVALQRECEANGQLTALLATERSMKTTAEADLQFQKAETDQTASKLSESNEMVKRLKKRLHGAKQESDRQLSDSNGVVERMKHKLKELASAKGELERRSNRQQSELGETQERVRELMEDLDKRRENIRRLEAELQEIKDTVSEMKRLEKQGSAERQEERQADVARELEREERERLKEEEREMERAMERTRERQREVEREREAEREEQRRTEKQSETQMRQQEKSEWLKREAELSQKLLDLEHRFKKKSSPVADEATRRVLLDMRGTIQKLTKEKAELRQTLLTLEEAVDSYRRRENERVEVEMDEREIAWGRDKAELELAVKTKEEDRKWWKEETINSYKEARCYYDFFIRSEGFRKSLAFQKRFLLVRLGGFQDCERAALSLLSDVSTVGDTNRRQRFRHPGFRLRKAIVAVVAVTRLRLLAGKWSHFGYPESKEILRQHPAYRPGRGRRMTDDVLGTKATSADTGFSHSSRTPGSTSTRAGHMSRLRHYPVVFQPPERGIQDSLPFLTTASATTDARRASSDPSRDVRCDSATKSLNTWNGDRQDQDGSQQQRQHLAVQSDSALEAYIQRLDDLRDRISSRTRGHGNKYY